MFASAHSAAEIRHQCEKKEFQSIKSNRESNFTPTRAGDADDVAAAAIQLQMPPSYAIELSLSTSQ